MIRRMKQDIKAVFERDPAARNLSEVLLCYPGLHALWIYRVSHFLWTHKLKFLGRFLSHLNRWLTGIEIHPRAKIGKRVFIDHGSGVVVGETAEIGDDVLIYQGVVLGGTSRDPEKRHPTVGNRVELGAGAVLLGPIEIGDEARIGAGSVVTNSIPSGSTAVGVPAHIRSEEVSRVSTFQLDHADIPDPLQDIFRYVLQRQVKLERRIAKAEGDKKRVDNGDTMRNFKQGAGI